MITKAFAIVDCLDDESFEDFLFLFHKKHTVYYKQDSILTPSYPLLLSAL